MSEPKNNFPIKFIAFAMILFIVIFIVEKINHRFWLNDFKVYYDACGALLNGKQVYGTAFALGSGYYKYSTFTLLPFIPLHFFNYPVACVIHYFMMAFSIISLFLLIQHINRNYIYFDKSSNENIILTIAFVCGISHFVRELHLGNINAALLLLLCFSLFFILRSQFIVAGMLLAFVLVTKPFFILLMLPLLMHKKIKVLFNTGIFVLICLMLPALFLGIEKNITLLKEWIQTMLEHNDSFFSSNTIEYIVGYYFSFAPPAYFKYIILLKVCILYIVYWWLTIYRQRKKQETKMQSEKNFILEWFVIIAITPSLFRTDTQHFLLSLPLILLVVNRLVTLKKYIYYVLFFILAFFYGGNSTSIVGKKLSDEMDTWGILGITNLLIIAFAITIWFIAKQKREIKNSL